MYITTVSVLQMQDYSSLGAEMTKRMAAMCKNNINIFSVNIK